MNAVATDIPRGGEWGPRDLLYDENTRLREELRTVAGERDKLAELVESAHELVEELAGWGTERVAKDALVWLRKARTR